MGLFCCLRQNVNSANFPSGAPPFYGQAMASRQSTTMWSGLPPGRSATYEVLLTSMFLLSI